MDVCVVCVYVFVIVDQAVFGLGGQRRHLFNTELGNKFKVHYTKCLTGVTYTLWRRTVE